MPRAAMLLAIARRDAAPRSAQLLDAHAAPRYIHAHSAIRTGGSLALDTVHLMAPASGGKGGLDAARTAVFTGAGLSAAGPASLPMGYALRDEVLRFMFERARRFAPDLVPPEQLEQLSVPERKLEQVLGRLWRITGSDALDCLHCLAVAVPNRAHMLAAVHLARGGTQATVNLDRGVEMAYELIAGRTDIPSGWARDYGEALGAWRVDTREIRQPLRIVASREQFDAWVADGKPPALLKVHGSLSYDGASLVDVVVEDTEELGGLAPSRRAAIDLLAEAALLIIIGYGGLDPDVYRPLLRSARQTQAVWATKWIDEDSPLHEDLVLARVRPRVGDPDGLATTVLSDLVGVTAAWPESRPAHEPTWHERFARWSESFEAGHEPEKFALSWAWLLADSGDRDAAVALLGRLLARSDAPVVWLRLADVLYDRARGDDRDRAGQLYWSLAWTRGADWSTRGHALLRLGGIARGRAVRQGGWRALPQSFVAIAMPLAVLAEQRRRGDRKDPELTAAALAVLGQTILRGCEAAMAWCPAAAFPLLAAALRRGGAICGEAARTSTNGNRRALAMSHQLLALALASLVAGDGPDAEWSGELDGLVATYVNAGDLAGAGNCCSALAVLAATQGDRTLARRQLDRARAFYAEGRADNRLIPSGAALIDRLDAILSRMWAPDR